MIDNLVGDELFGLITTLQSGLGIEEPTVEQNWSVRKAQNRLYEIYSGKMIAFVRRNIKCPFIAGEIVNDGWLRVFKKIDLYTFKGSFEGWMRRIMRHAVCDAVAHDDWGRNVGLESFDAVGKAYIPFVDNIDYKELQVMIWRLPKTTGQVFMAYLSGMKHVEIAKKYGMSEGTSKWHVSEAKAALKKLIKR